MIDDLFMTPAKIKALRPQSVLYEPGGLAHAHGKQNMFSRIYHCDVLAIS